ncbi:ABC transporter permease subunit [Pseudomonas sp. Ap32]|nr:ABC transporter permease subunit [Pseudomonas sp. Ap32]
MKRFSFSKLMLVLGLLFIYLPMLILVIYSFNASKLVTVWGLVDQVVRRPARQHPADGFGDALAGNRLLHGGGSGGAGYPGSLRADPCHPLQGPHAVRWPGHCAAGNARSDHRSVAVAAVRGHGAVDRLAQERGVVTIWIAHTTFCAAYVAVVVSARLRELDLSIEEAAMDLGAKPWKVFFLITIPMIAPSLAAGGMMSFALSLDDLVLASFVSGPGSTTLPMEVFSAVRLGVKPEINAVASLILLSVSLVTFFVWYFSRQAEERRRKAIQQAIEEGAAANASQPQVKRSAQVAASA